VKSTSLGIQAKEKEGSLKKIRFYLVAIALIMSLSGIAFLGIGVASSIASAASRQHVSTSALVAKSTGSVSFIPKPWCPGLGIAC
ncbi:MAG: hypothetical protein ACXVCM_11435, partial [Ktedonobacteraceae bacterium]